MFEIKKPHSSNKTIRLPDEMITELEKIAGKKEVSFNEVVKQCIEYALRQLNEQELSRERNQAAGHSGAL